MIELDLELRRGTASIRCALRSDARVTGLYGPSGAGKTSLLLAMAGLLRPARGSIRIDGEVLFDAARGIHVPPERRGLGVVFQEGRLFPHLTVRENLRFARRVAGREGPGFDEVVHLLGLEPMLSRFPSDISGGEARRVAIGRALLARPRLLILDEPLTGLDPRLRRRVLAHLMRLRESLDLRMLYVSHTFSDFLALVDFMAVMRGGTVEASGPPTEMMALALEAEAGDPLVTLLRGEVLRAGGGLATVSCDGVPFELALPEATPGDFAWVGIDARDVVLFLAAPPPGSARNRFPGRVAEVRQSGDRVLVLVDAGPRFWVEVTEGARRELGLEPGREVFALIKARALRGEVLPA